MNQHTKLLKELVEEGFFKKEEGDIYMYIDNRNISTGNISGGNNNFNTGDNVSQKIEISNGEHSDLFKELFKKINQLQDEDDKQDAIENTQKLQEAIEKGNKSRAEKLFGWLPQAIQTCQAAVNVYQQIQTL